MLHVDGHIAGLHQKIADTGGGILHHQFPGVVVVFGTAVAHACQQVVDLVAQPALGQGHVQHDLLPGAGSGVGHAVQLVQVQGKADGTGTLAELSRQGVVPPTLQNRPGQAGQVALEHQAVVVFHIVDQGQVQLQIGRLTLGLQGVAQRPQLGEGRTHGGVESQGLRRVQHRLPVAGQSAQAAQGIPALLGKARFRGAAL